MNNNYERISLDMAKSIALNDGTMLSSTPSDYQKANALQYYLALNTWALMCLEVCGARPAQSLTNYILVKGLVQTIKDAQDLANDLILQDFRQASLDHDLSFLFVEDPQLSMQLLRYLKRFSPDKADLVKKASIDAFLQVNSSCKGEPAVIAYSQGWSRNRNGWVLSTGPVLKYSFEYPAWLIECVKGYLFEMLPDIPISEADVLQRGYFSTGATAEGCHTELEKMRQFSKENAHLISPRFPLLSDQQPTCDFVKVVAVPKSYKSCRIIAEVPASLQYRMQGLRKISEECTMSSRFKELIVLDDQSYNQEQAFIGSVHGTVATIDLSAASDSISHTLAEQIMPKVWYDAIDAINPPYLLVEGQRRRRWIFQTSGNGTTFDFESKIFLSIALAATEYASLYLEEVLEQPRVYGDDLICDVKAFDTLVDFLNLLGFTVNRDKSFTVPSRYRESCGAEFWCGLDTHTEYFPRKVLTFFEFKNKKKVPVPEVWESVIALQHRLYRFQKVDEFLVEFIRTQMLENFNITMTSSLPGTDCADLWEAVPLFIKGMAPMVGNEPEPVPPEILREGHYALVRSRSKLPNDFIKGDGRVTGDDDIIHMFDYVRFLQKGPQFDSNLDELLGVRSHRVPLSDRASVPTTKWRLVF